MSVYRQNPPPELDDAGFEVKREFTVRHLLHRPPLQAGVWRWWVHCYRNTRYSGGTPYSYEDARACVVRLLGDGWAPQPGHQETLFFLDEIAL